MIIFKILMAIIILIVIPMCIGMLATVALGVKERSFGLLLPMGYAFMFLLFEMVTLPVLFTTSYQNFQYVVCIYTPLMLIFAVLGLFIAIKRTGSFRNIFTDMGWGFDMYRNGKKEAMIVWAIAAAALIFILYMAETRVIFDGDDAYYVVQSLITWQHGSMYVTMPYTGGAAPIDLRHAMAVFTMWITYVGTVTGIHTTIVCHTILPLILIPLTLGIYTEIGARFLEKKKIMLPYFAVLCEVLILFGRISLFTAETFLLARTWQGKSMAANVLLPLAVLALIIHMREEGKGSYIMLLLVDAVAGIFSSLAVVLVSVLIGCGAIIYAIYTKNWKKLIFTGLCCTPGVLYMLLYLVLI